MNVGRRLLVASLGVVFVAAADVPGPAPRQDAWQVVGPGGGGTMRRPPSALTTRAWSSKGAT